MAGLLSRMLPLLVAVGLILLWEAIVVVANIPDFLLPSPVSIITKMLSMPERLAMHTLVTLKEVLVGFSLALIGGVLLASLMTQIPWFGRAVFPLLIVSQTVPTIAVAPLLVIWFGPGETARLIVVFLICFFPIVVNSTSGLLRVDRDLVDMANGLKASPWRVFLKIRLPNALPHIFTGMRISIALAVIGAVVSEFVAAERGLGYLVFTASSNLDTRLVFTAVTLLAAMGIVLFQSVRLLQGFSVPWLREEPGHSF